VTSPPQLSVILVTDQYRTIRPVVARLRAQAARARLEIVLVVPAGHTLEPEPGALEGFGGVRCVEVPSIVPLSTARVAGIHAATAPVVVIGETHSFPLTGWAEALIEAHAGPWAVVVPAFVNANPESALSWAAFIRDYGLWVEGLPAGPLGTVPAYNTAMKRDVLLTLDGRLEDLISHGEALIESLRAAGHRACFHPAAAIEHANVSRLWAWIAQRFVTGRVLGASRARRWSLTRRLLYLCGAPLIPAVIVGRLSASVRQVLRTRRPPAGTLAALALGAVVSAAGETVSYLLGGGTDQVRRADEYELFKLRYTALPPP
jgi:hypothetical protein